MYTVNKTGPQTQQIVHQYRFGEDVPTSTNSRVIKSVRCTSLKSCRPWTAAHSRIVARSLLHIERKDAGTRPPHILESCQVYLPHIRQESCRMGCESSPRLSFKVTALPLARFSPNGSVPDRWLVWCASARTRRLANYHRIISMICQNHRADLRTVKRILLITNTCVRVRLGTPQGSCGPPY